MNSSLAPATHLGKIIRNWWVISLAMILGGIGGWVTSNMKRPVYESKSILSTSIDYVQSGYLTDIEEDQILNLIGDNLLSDDFLAEVVDRLSGSEINTDPKKLRDVLFIERQGYHWTMRARNENAAFTQELVSTWSDVVEDQLTAYQYHANNAQIINREIEGLSSCYIQQKWVEPSSVLCSHYDNDELQNELDGLTASFTRELEKGHGIDPAARFEITLEASSPKQVAYHRNEMILASMVLGLLAGIVIVFSPLMIKMEKRTTSD